MSGAPKKQFRKPKRRTSRDLQNEKDEIRHETDLEELWGVLAETKESSSWGVPWRNGCNAIALTLQVAREQWDQETIYASGDGERLKLSAVDAVQGFIKHPTIEGLVYWTMQEHLEALEPRMYSTGDRLLLISLRMIQLWIANSHGGGIAFNTLLEPIWSRSHDSILREKLMRKYRCTDALDIEPEFTQVAEDDRLRRAFYTAWDRGLYHVAYAVGRIRVG